MSRVTGIGGGYQPESVRKPRPERPTNHIGVAASEYARFSAEFKRKHALSVAEAAARRKRQNHEI